MFLSRLVLLAAATLALPAFAATYPGGSVFVAQADSSSGTAVAASIRIFQTNGKEQATLSIPKGKLQFQSGRGGRIALSLDGKFVGLAGYVPPFSGSGNLNTRSDGEAARAYLQVNAKTGAILKPVKVKDQNAEAADAVVTDGSRAWLGGGDDLVYWNDGKTDVIFNEGTFTTTLLPNSLRAFNSQLYMTGTRPLLPGFVAKFDGMPHGDSDNPANLFDRTTAVDVATEDGSTLYVARSEGVVEVFEKDGSDWTYSRRFTAGVGLRALSVDFTGENPVLYAVDSKNLWKATDKGGNGAMKTIASAKSGKTFTGVVVTPGGGAPQLTLTTPRVYSTTRSTVTIRGTAQDADGIKKIKAKRGRNGSYRTATGTTEWSFRTNLKRGANYFFIVAVDGANNESTPLPVKITRQ